MNGQLQMEPAGGTLGQEYVLDRWLLVYRPLELHEDDGWDLTARTQMASRYIRCTKFFELPFLCAPAPLDWRFKTWKRHALYAVGARSMFECGQSKLYLAHLWTTDSYRLVVGSWSAGRALNDRRQATSDKRQSIIRVIS